LVSDELKSLRIKDRYNLFLYPAAFANENRIVTHRPELRKEKAIFNQHGVRDNIA